MKVLAANLSLATALLLTSTLFAGCSLQSRPDTSPPTPKIQAALTFYEAGQHEAALDIAQKIILSDEAASTERERAKSLATIIYLQQDNWEQVEEIAAKLENSEDAGIDARLLRHALTAASSEVSHHIDHDQSTEACEKTIRHLRDERQNLENTLKKLRELSLE